MCLRLWVDDVRPAPSGYTVAKTVNDAINKILLAESLREIVEVIDIDHDAGSYSIDGGDYIKILDWLEETGRNYPLHIHSMNPVGVENMRAIIRKMVGKRFSYG